MSIGQALRALLMAVTLHALPQFAHAQSATSPWPPGDELGMVVTGAVFPYTDGATNSEVELLGGSLGLWPTKRMDATSTSPRVTRHVWRASDGGSGGMASARPMINLPLPSCALPS